MRSIWGVLLGVVVVLASTVAGAVDAPFCDEVFLEDCADDVLAVEYLSGGDELSGATVGTQYTVVALYQAVRSIHVQGWSWGVWSDPVYLDVLNATDNFADPPVSTNSFFIITQPATTSNDGFIQAVALDFSPPTYMPLGAHDLEMARSLQQVIAAPPPDGAYIAMMSGLQGSGQPVDLTITINSTSLRPRKLRHAVVLP